MTPKIVTPTKVMPCGTKVMPDGTKVMPDGTKMCRVGLKSLEWPFNDTDAFETYWLLQKGEADISGQLFHMYFFYLVCTVL